ncbi:MAG: hypothetical protein GY761_18740 [Hyphomicrobiales bacterium]|nr:hypothetical protein [Hyphomicrobiales bacterium]
MEQALNGLDTFLREDDSPLYQHDLIGAVVSSYLGRLRGSFASWEDRIAYADRFQISKAESGFPGFRNVLELENDRKTAKSRLKTMPSEEDLREEMIDFILRKKKFPTQLQKSMAERSYLSTVLKQKHFSPLVLPRTIRVSVNPKTKRPYYIVHWGYFDGSANLPLVYMAVIEDSSSDIVKTLVKRNGKLNKAVNIPLPVDGLLNPDLAHKFDDFCEKNSSYSLTLSTVASSMDKDFEMLHPKQVRRFVLGPFYHAGITEHGHLVEEILGKVRKPENSWLMTWTMQEIYSIHETPAKWGIWGGEPARNQYYINSEDVDCARQGVSAFLRHALVPHESYQAIYASGKADEIFEGYQKNIVSGNQILRNM